MRILANLLRILLNAPLPDRKKISARPFLPSLAAILPNALKFVPLIVEKLDTRPWTAEKSCYAPRVSLRSACIEFECAMNG
jgi:hypothetical protein